MELARDGGAFLEHCEAPVVHRPQRRIHCPAYERRRHAEEVALPGRRLLREPDLQHAERLLPGADCRNIKQMTFTSPAVARRFSKAPGLSVVPCLLRVCAYAEGCAIGARQLCGAFKHLLDGIWQFRPVDKKLLRGLSKKLKPLIASIQIRGLFCDFSFQRAVEPIKLAHHEIEAARESPDL